jgi:hypothetical protein
LSAARSGPGQPVERFVGLERRGSGEHASARIAELFAYAALALAPAFRGAAQPRPTKPIRIMAQVEASGADAMSTVNVSPCSPDPQETRLKQLQLCA